MSLKATHRKEELLMRVLTSPVYLEHLKQLIAQGRAQGLIQGRTKEARSIALRQLTKKFGTLSEDLQTAIEQLSIDQTSDLIDALLDFGSIDDLQTWLLALTAKQGKAEE
jgi:hypothetical protein